MEPRRRKTICVSPSRLAHFNHVADIKSSRTYDDEDQGEVVRDGFEPGQLDNASDENITYDDDEQNKSNGKSKEPAKYDSLDDRHVWDSKHSE